MTGEKYMKIHWRGSEKLEGRAGSHIMELLLIVML
jgi:hypothetical protein